MKLNIIMVTKDRPVLLKQTIRSLYEHTTVNFDLTVVDDCSTDIWTLRRLQDEHGFFVILNQEPTPLGESKNKVLRSYENDLDGLVYITDNDVYFTPGWADKLLQAWKNRDRAIKILGGGCHKYLGTNLTYVHEDYEIHLKDALSGWSWLFEKQTWDEFGPLDGNALGSGQSEDWAFCQKIRAAGYEVASIWPEVVIHCGRTNTEGGLAVGSETISTDLAGVIVE